MHVIGVCDVDEIRFCFLHHAVHVGKDESRLCVFLTEVDGPFYALLASQDSCHFDLPGKFLAEHPQDFLHYFPCAYDAYLHSFFLLSFFLFLFLIRYSCLQIALHGFLYPLVTVGVGVQTIRIDLVDIVVVGGVHRQQA